MSTSYISKSAPALMAALAISATLAQAQSLPDLSASPAGSSRGLKPLRPFQNLVTDDAALQAWTNIPGKDEELNTEGEKALPLGDFVRHTAKLFQDQFDIIFPSDDWARNTITVKLHLKNVRAIEIFNAMNLYFEAEKIPASWKLALNGTRPTAILSAEPPRPAAAPPAASDTKTTVFSVGDFIYQIGPTALYKQSATNLLNSLEAVFADIPAKPGTDLRGGVRAEPPVIKIHAEAGILVFTGTAEQTALVRSTLEALTDARRRKADAVEREQKAESKEIR